jgi:hypothetical protein
MIGAEVVIGTLLFTLEQSLAVTGVVLPGTVPRTVIPCMSSH